MTTPRYTSEEAARRGHEIYERAIKPVLRPEHLDQFLAIDVDSEDFELDSDDREVTKRLRARKPGAEIFVMRVGHPAAYRIGRPVGNESPG